MSEGRQQRGVTTCPRSGQRQRVPGCDGTGMAERSYPTSEVRGSGREELPHAPMTEARGGRREGQTHIQGAVAAQAPKGLEELSHVEGQEGRW